MASLIEELMQTLEGEIVQYEALLKLSQEKTPIIVKGDIVALQKITDEEQTVVDAISHLDSKREEITKDIANVLNKDVETLKLSVLIEILGKQPKEQAQLADIHDRLKTVVDNVKKINSNNSELIAHSLEMVEFDLNLLKAMKQAPETANYGSNAFNSGNILGSAVSGFDAKQ
ncbi:MAG: flagellar protein FlgN [Lachnospiraceae bacterium]|nr:flagellar protein FlgN [Lachnospiraceae bacterium]